MTWRSIKDDPPPKAAQILMAWSNHGWAGPNFTYAVVKWSYEMSAWVEGLSEIVGEGDYWRKIRPPNA